jgi:23S rRNA U2552 (ribose-2'-O)-methylase RlmE/FtsJ
MKDFESLENEFVNYNPLVFDLNSIDTTNVLGSNCDVQFSNNICFPEVRLGFHHFIHQAKDKMEAVEEFSSRKKIYLVTSLFEKNIDYKEKTDDGVDFMSIDNGIKSLIKNVKPDFPPLLNRAFLKMWEMLVEFDLIPESDNFVSSHLAEGPGSFIQATILYRELQAKLGKIKSCAKDNYYGVTLHSDHDHLLMHEEFIKYFSKEANKRLHIMETKSIKELKDLYGGGGKNPSSGKTSSGGIITNGDLTKLNTIKQFAGGKDVIAFTKPSDLVTSDGGFDWKRENLQEQEAYRLIFSEIVTALKVQKDGGNFVIKIFESYTKITIKMIELVRQLYTQVYIAKPYTSRISNSEKYLVCKGFKKSVCTVKLLAKLEEQVQVMNKNEQYQILDMFTDIELSDTVYRAYNKINSELLLKQYGGINNIIKFINLDNYNGIEFNEYLDKQIVAAHFWNNFFLEPKLYSKIVKLFKKFNFIEYKKEIESKKLENNDNFSNSSFESQAKSVQKSESEPENKIKEKVSRSKISKTTKAISDKSNKSVKSVKTKINKSLKKNLKGGGMSEDSDVDLLLEYQDASIESSDEIIGKLESDDDSGIVDLNAI